MCEAPLSNPLTLSQSKGERELSDPLLLHERPHAFLPSRSISGLGFRTTER
jgi:hypothetical protein